MKYPASNIFAGRGTAVEQLPDGCRIHVIAANPGTYHSYFGVRPDLTIQGNGSGCFLQIADAGLAAAERTSEAAGLAKVVRFYPDNTVNADGDDVMFINRAEFLISVGQSGRLESQEGRNFIFLSIRMVAGESEEHVNEFEDPEFGTIHFESKFLVAAETPEAEKCEALVLLAVADCVPDTGASRVRQIQFGIPTVFLAEICDGESDSGSSGGSSSSGESSSSSSSSSGSSSSGSSSSGSSSSGSSSSGSDSSGGDSSSGSTGDSSGDPSDPSDPPGDSSSGSTSSSSGSDSGQSSSSSSSGSSSSGSSGSSSSSTPLDPTKYYAMCERVYDRLDCKGRVIQTGNFVARPQDMGCVNNEPLTGFSKNLTPVAGPFDTYAGAVDWLNNNFEYFSEICVTT